MKDNFDLKKYLTENRLTPLSKHSKQHPDFISYKGAKYRRVGLVNENSKAPIAEKRQNVFSGPVALWALEASENLGPFPTGELYADEMNKYILAEIGSNYDIAEAIKEYCRPDFAVADTNFTDVYFKFPMRTNFRSRADGSEDIHQALRNAFHQTHPEASELIRNFKVAGFLLHDTGEVNLDSGIDGVSSEASKIYLLSPGYDNIENVLEENGEYRGQF